MTTEGRWRLTVRKEFSASHALRHFRGKCEALHGHNFGVDAVVEGAVLEPDVEIVVDFGVLKTALAEVLQPLDHCHLNETPPFDRLNPSSENLSRHIYRALAPRLAALGVHLAEVTVSEKDGQSATYLELPGPVATERAAG